MSLDKTSPGEGKGGVGIEWKLPAPLAPGWWRGVVEFGPREGDDKGWVNYHLGFVAVSGRKPLVDLMASFKLAEKAPEKPAQRFEFWVYCSEPTPAVRLQPVYDELWKYKRTWPVARVTLEKSAAAPSLSPADAVTLDLPVRPDGSVPLPGALPAGNWSLHAPMTKEGSVTCVGDDGRAVKAPFTFNRWHQPSAIQLYAGSPVRRVTFETAAMFKDVLVGAQQPPARRSAGGGGRVGEDGRRVEDRDGQT